MHAADIGMIAKLWGTRTPGGPIVDSENPMNKYAFWHIRKIMQSLQ